MFIILLVFGKFRIYPVLANTELFGLKKRRFFYYDQCFSFLARVFLSKRMSKWINYGYIWNQDYIREKRTIRIQNPLDRAFILSLDILSPLAFWLS